MEKKSQILIAAFIMLLVSMLLCRGIFTLWSNHAQSIAAQVASGQAFYLAQGALERAKSDLLLNATRAGSWPRTKNWNAPGGASDFTNFNANIPTVNANYFYSITCNGSAGCASNDRSITATGQVYTLAGKLLSSRTMFVTITNVYSASTQDSSANLVANTWEEQ